MNLRRLAATIPQVTGGDNLRRLVVATIPPAAGVDDLQRLPSRTPEAAAASPSSSPVLVRWRHLVEQAPTSLARPGGGPAPHWPLQ